MKVGIGEIIPPCLSVCRRKLKPYPLSSNTSVSNRPGWKEMDSVCWSRRLDHYYSTRNRSRD